MVELSRIDLHTHSFLSDGELLPSEALRRVSVLGYRALAITDHADASNLAHIVETLRRMLDEPTEDFATRLLVGVELTHVAPGSIARLARRAKELGAEVVVVHGETLVEPVAPGTNRAAVECAEVDLLAHPGLLTHEEASRAAQRGCLIEVTTRKGHSLANGHVVRVAREVGAPMVVDSDSHAVGDYPTHEFAQRVARGAGMTEAEVLAATVGNPGRMLERILAARGVRAAVHSR